MRKRDLAKKMRVIINVGIWYYSLFSKKTLQKKFNHSKYLLGYGGLLKRYCIVKNLAKSCGDNVAIFDNVVMNDICNMEIGNNVSINTGTYIEAYGGVIIGNDVSIAHDVSVLSTNHKFNCVDVPIKEQGVVTGKVIINDDVWIGCKAIILMNVEVGEGCVVGAGAVVAKNTLPYSVNVGIPTKVVRMRK